MAIETVMASRMQTPRSRQTPVRLQQCRTTTPTSPVSQSQAPVQRPQDPQDRAGPGAGSPGQAIALP